MISRAALFTALISGPAPADTLGINVYDGDTLAPTARLTIDGDLSFDAPEKTYKFGAECEAEVALGRKARRRLREILKDAERVDVFPILEPDGTIRQIGRSRKRLLLRVEADGENVGVLLEREGLAMFYDWRTQKADWCAVPPVLRAKP